MKVKHLLTALISAAGLFPLVAGAALIYPTANGDLNLVAGLTNLTSVTAINTVNQSVGINYITDSSWSATGIANLGQVTYGGSLAGTFGGANYFASSNNVILIGGANSQGNASWGNWTVRMLLSDDTYSSNSISYLNSVLVNNTNPASRLVTNNSFFNNGNATTFTSTNALFNTYYQLLNIADFDSLNIGVKGIELSGMTNINANQFPDITYIGVTATATPIPEPGTWAAMAIFAGGAAYVGWRRRRQRTL